MTKTAPYLWALGVLIVLGGQLLPGAPHGNWVVIALIFAAAAAHSASCIWVTDMWARLPMRVHAASTGVAVALVGTAVAATGGGDTYLRPGLFLLVLYVAFFFPARFAWPLVFLLIVALVAPLLYDTDGLGQGFPSSAFATSVAFAGLTLAMQRLKGRLVEAEIVQRTMASQDPLTGVANRRAFDNALAARLAPFEGSDRPERSDDRFALLFVDVDHFKQINDTLGHVTGDRVLRELSVRCDTVVRPGDLFARIGGDEFALIAAGVDAGGAEEIATRLRSEAGAITLAEHAPPLSITVAWSTFPADGSDPSSLMSTADHRLHAEKDARYAHTYRLRPPAEYME